MSRLIDKFNEIAKAVPKPMGFRTETPVSTKAKMLLIAGVAQANNIERLADYVTGADAVLIARMSARARTSPQMDKLPDIPWGLRLEDIDSKQVTSILKAGCDFLVFTDSLALAIPENEKLGKVLQVETSLGEGLIKTLNGLPVDAVMVAGEPGEASVLTWHHLMLFQRFADLLTKPLLICLPAKVTASELQALWNTGVDGVVVDIETGEPEGSIKELRQMIDNLTFPTRERKKVAALLPHLPAGVDTATDAEEEEEEEEEP